MSNMLVTIPGARGRSITLYDNKCVIRTVATAGSLLTGNATDGEKTIFYIDCTGVQFKEAGITIGYLQLETPSMQMNNMASNFFSENTFTFESTGSSHMNRMMRDVYRFVVDRMEGYKYGTNTQPMTQLPEYLREYFPEKRAAGRPADSFYKPTAPTPAVQSAPAERWTCSNCGNSNKPTAFSCSECGTSKQMSMLKK